MRLRYLPHRAWKRLRAVVYWARFGWGWYPWDYSYGLRALDHHLAALHDACRDGHGVTGARDAARIRVARELIRRVVEGSSYLMLSEFGGPQSDVRRMDVRDTLAADRRAEAQLYAWLARYGNSWWD